MITDELTLLIQQALQNAKVNGDLPLEDANQPVMLETPKNKQFGDYSSNIALTLKKLTGIQDSRLIATTIQKNLPENDMIAKTDVAGPGFLNFYLKPDWLHNTLLRIEAELGTEAKYAGWEALRTK